MDKKELLLTKKEVESIFDKWNDIDSKEMAYATNARPAIEDMVGDIIKAQLAKASAYYNAEIKEIRRG